MPSLMVPKWIRSELRSDIITKSLGQGVKLAPAHNNLRPLAYKSLRHQPESEECKNGLKTAACQTTSTVLLPNLFLLRTAGLKISLPTSNETRA